MYLSDMEPGQKARIIKLDNDSIGRRLLDIGLTTGVKVECIGQSPCGDPKAYWIRGAVIAIRSEDAKKIVCDGTD